MILFATLACASDPVQIATLGRTAWFVEERQLTWGVSGDRLTSYSHTRGILWDVAPGTFTVIETGLERPQHLPRQETVAQVVDNVLVVPPIEGRTAGFSVPRPPGCGLHPLQTSEYVVLPGEHGMAVWDWTGNRIDPPAPIDPIVQIASDDDSLYTRHAPQGPVWRWTLDGPVLTSLTAMPPGHPQRVAWKGGHAIVDGPRVQIWR